MGIIDGIKNFFEAKPKKEEDKITANRQEKQNALYKTRNYQRMKR